MEGQRGDVGFVTFELEFRRSFGQIEFAEVDLLLSLTGSSFVFEVLLQIGDLFLKVVDFFLERKDGLPFHFESVALGVDICEGDVDLL